MGFFAIFATVAGVVLVGLGLARASGHAARREEADDLEAARLRLLDEGVDVHNLPPVTAVLPRVPDWDERTQVLVVDPTLRPAEVAELVEHVAPGAGSVASLGHLAEDTRIRSVGQLEELRAAELAAYAEATEREDREFFARFDRVMSVALANFRRDTARADAWAFYVHDDAHADCPHCRAALDEVSDEYAQIVRRVSLEDTRSFTKADLTEIFAVGARA